MQRLKKIHYSKYIIIIMVLISIYTYRYFNQNVYIVKPNTDIIDTRYVRIIFVRNKNDKSNCEDDILKNNLLNTYCFPGTSVYLLHRMNIYKPNLNSIKAIIRNSKLQVRNVKEFKGLIRDILMIRQGKELTKYIFGPIIIEPTKQTILNNDFQVKEIYMYTEGSFLEKACINKVRKSEYQKINDEYFADLYVETKTIGITNLKIRYNSERRDLQILENKLYCDYLFRYKN